MSEAALKVEPREVEVTVGLDEPQLRGMLELWQAWTKEEGRVLNTDTWARYVHGRIGSGSFLPIVAWDGNIPVGMAEFGVQVDPFTDQVTGFGDHLYVLPEYRREGVFAAIYRAAEALAWIFDTEAHVLPVSVRAGFLRPYYEREGFKVVGHVMRREA